MIAHYWSLKRSVMWKFQDSTTHLCMLNTSSGFAMSLLKSDFSLKYWENVNVQKEMGKRPFSVRFCTYITLKSEVKTFKCREQKKKTFFFKISCGLHKVVLFVCVCECACVPADGTLPLRLEGSEHDNDRIVSGRGLDKATELVSIHPDNRTPRRPLHHLINLLWQQILNTQMRTRQWG